MCERLKKLLMYNNFYHHALHQHQTTGHCSFVCRYLISDHLFRFIDVGVNVANKAGTLWCVEMAECTRVTGQVRLECLSQTPSSHSVCAIRTPLGVDQKIQERTHAGCMTEGKRTVKQLVWRTYCSFFVLHSEATSMIISQGVWPLKFRSWTFIAVNE